jgi:hypothetical protein
MELSKKANVEDVHSKTEMETITGEIYASITENFNSLNATLLKKAFADDVYTTEEVYTKEEVNAIADNKADKEDSYTKDQLYTITEVDAAFSALRDELPTKVSELDNDAAYLVWSQVEHFAEAEAMITALAGKVDVEEGNVLIPLASAEKIASLPTRQEYNDRMTALDTAILNMTGDINTEA